MGNYNTFVGMDVHTTLIVCKGLVKETGEYRNKSFRNETMIYDLIEGLKTLPSPVYCAYESGLTGFYLARELRKHDIECDVIAVSTLSRSPKDKKTKNDKTDARVILNAITSIDKKYSCTGIPDEETESEREINRLRVQLTSDLIRAKQQLLSFLTKNNCIGREKTKSGNKKKKGTRCFGDGLKDIKFDYPLLNIALNKRMTHIKNLEIEIKDITKQIEELALNEENIKVVSALTQCKGIDLKTAYLIKSEIGNFNRFTSGRKISSWAGLIPKTNISNLSDKKGPITKMGNKYIRKALIEGVTSAYRGNQNPKKNEYSKNCSTRTIQLANECNIRCYEKYNFLIYEKQKNANLAKVAVANELIKGILFIGRSAQNECTNNVEKS